MGEQRDKQEPIHPGQQVLSSDYGKGTIEGVFPPFVSIRWDKPFLPGTNPLVHHDVAFAERLEKLPPEGKEST
jgi:hypothetical protein